MTDIAYTITSELWESATREPDGVDALAIDHLMAFAARKGHDRLVLHVRGGPGVVGKTVYIDLTSAATPTES